MGEVIRDNQSGHQRGRRLMVPSQHLELPLKLLDLGLSLGGVIAHRCALLRDGLPQLGHLMREIIIGDQRRSEAIRWSAAARPPDEGDHQRQSERSAVIRELLSEPIREVIRGNQRAHQRAHQRGHQRQSESPSERSSERPSEAIRESIREVIRGHSAYHRLENSLLIRGHQRSSEVIRGHQRSPSPRKQSSDRRSRPSIDEAQPRLS